MAANYQIKTINGYDFFEASSAFQKAIRRGEEDEAMFWMVEIHKSGYTKYLWKRIIIIASEDIGLGDPDVIVKIMALKQSYDYLVKEQNTHNAEILPFIQAALTLIRAKKSRFVDLSYAVYWRKHSDQSGNKSIPDYALDCHTRKGKKMGRGDLHFYKVGAVIHNANLIEREAGFLELEMAYSELTDGK